MNILLILNKPERELSIMNKLKTHILLNDADAVVDIIDFHDPDFLVRTLDFSPNVIVVFPFSAYPIAYLFYLIKFALDCHIVCFRTEGVLNFDSEQHVNSIMGFDKYGSTLVDYEIEWGGKASSIVADCLLKQGKISSKSRVIAFGYPNYEVYFNGDYSSKLIAHVRIRHIITNYPSERILFFVTGFAFADYEKEDIIRAGDLFDVTNKHEFQSALDKRLSDAKKCAALRKLWIKYILETAKNCPNSLIIVKSHPTENIIKNRSAIDHYESFNTCTNIIYISEQADISEIMPFCGIFFHYGSTSAAEAYFLKIPSVLITSEIIALDDIKWPATETIDITELPVFVQNHLASPIKFQNYDEIETILDGAFNIKRKHLSGEAIYQPSKDFASFLVSLKHESVQNISIADPHFDVAIKLYHRYFSKILEHLLSKGTSTFHEQNFQSSLSYYMKMHSISEIMGIVLFDIHYNCALCHIKLGNLKLAEDELMHECSINPNHKDALKLLLSIREKHATTLNQNESSGTVSTINNHSITPCATKETIPATFTIETSLACNLKCPECALGGGMIQRPKGFMTFDDFKILADKIRPYVKYLYLHLWGEPMLNPDIFAMIRYASAFTRTNISTNGMNMTPEMAEELITSGVTEIIVSIDGVTQEVYEQYRVGGDVHKAFTSLTMLQQLNIKHGSRVNISPQFVVFRHNQHEMPQYQKACHTIGLQPTFKAPYIRTINSRIAYSDDPKFSRPHYSDIPPLKKAMMECPNPVDVFTVLMDGSVVICCHDYAGHTSFGNLFHQDVLAIWQSRHYRKFRESILTGHAPDFCVKNCMSYFLDDKPSKTTGFGNDNTEHSDALTHTPLSSAENCTSVKVNLCGGPRKIDGYVNVDISAQADIVIDLERDLLPFPDNSADVVVCISAINYFTRKRAGEIINDVYRILREGGIARFATQDLRLLARYYLEQNREFYFQKLANGQVRFPGRTFADKLNEFFYGFHSGDKHCQYVYDFEALRELFIEAGFSVVEEKRYQESRIPGIESIDNRPEQMFFLEAIKKTGCLENDSEIKIGNLLRKIRGSVQKKQTLIAQEGSEYDQAVQLWSVGLHEQAWQHLLKALDNAPGNRMAVTMCAGILKKSNRLDNLISLYENYLSHGTGDSEIQSELADARNKKLTAEVPAVLINQRRVLLDKQFARQNSVQDDKTHLAGCIKWLSVAHDVNKRGGVAAYYYLDSERWEVDYPETTGYIIPVFLCYYRLTGDEEYLKRAVAMGDWEISIQYPGGGVGEPVGVYGLKPRVFNTSQIMLGWLALYRETGKDKYLEAAKMAADWIVTNQDTDGNWTRNTYRGPRAYKSRVAWSLLELFALTGAKKYQEAADRCISWVMDKSNPNGWFADNSLSASEKPWTHLIGYVLTGLLEIYRLDNASFDRRNVLNVLQNAAKAIAGFYLKQKKNAGANFVTLVGTFDSAWQSKDNWSCVTGTAQLEFFLRRMLRYVNDPQFLKAADMLIEDLKKLQMLDGFDNPNIFGGMPGSYPIGVGYCAYSIPNWGVKFFADSLLQRLLSEENQGFLG